MLDSASAAALADSSTDLVNLARLAGRHFVTPMLAPCIAFPEILQRLPEDFSCYLEFIHAENSQRNLNLRRQLTQAAAHLNGIDIEPLLLKGAIRLVDDLYPDPGWRFLRDLDILVPRERLRDAVAGLASIGYGFTRSPAEGPEQHRHLPPLHRHGEAAVIELHAELLSDWQELCPAEQVLARSRPVDLDGARVRVPEMADQLVHLITHDRFDSYLPRSGMFLLRSVFESALLCRYEPAVKQLLARTTDAGLARWARVWLGLTARLFPEYVARRPVADFGGRLQERALMAMERLDEAGRLRRLVWFGQVRLGDLLRSPAQRKHLRANIRSLDYHRLGIRRLHRFWTTG